MVVSNSDRRRISTSSGGSDAPRVGVPVPGDVVDLATGNPDIDELPIAQTGEIGAQPLPFAIPGLHPKNP